MILILIAELFYDTSSFHRNCTRCFIACTFIIIYARFFLAIPGYMLLFPINFPYTFCTVHAHAVKSVEVGRHDCLWWEPLLPAKHRTGGPASRCPEAGAAAPLLQHCSERGGAGRSKGRSCWLPFYYSPSTSTLGDKGIWRKMNAGVHEIISLVAHRFNDARWSIYVR
jgi:hypothetical protein